VIPTSPTLRILALLDAGQKPAQIAVALRLPKARIYTILRRERPMRKRVPRRRTSSKPDLARALRKEGVAPPRIASLLGCSAKYVYMALQGKR
jgi:hypothetical protein